MLDPPFSLPPSIRNQFNTSLRNYMLLIILALVDTSHQGARVSRENVASKAFVPIRVRLGEFI